MYILESPTSNKELPIKIHISFEKIYVHLEEIIEDSEHVLFHSAKSLLSEMSEYPILREGFTDFSLLHTYEKQIKKLLSILFPDLLQSNEIKAISIPFDMTSFMFSKRLKKIIDNAGEDFIFNIRNFEPKNMYIMTCLYILSIHYKKNIDFKRPFFYDIPDTSSNTVKSYRALYNADFATVIKTNSAPQLTEEDIKHLLNSFEDIDVWREKFPPNSYIFKGFGMINLFDVTQDETLSKIKSTFVKRNIDSLSKLQRHVRNLYNIDHLKLGISIYSKDKETSIDFVKYNKDHSLITRDICTNPKDHFCSSIVNRVFDSSLITAIPDLTKYNISTKGNKFSNIVIDNNIQSIILVPIELNNNFFAIFELGSKNKYELNSINATKLKDILPVLSITVERSIDERQNLLESVIQDNYTTIHPSVKWKFYKAAGEFIADSTHQPKLKNIYFKNVFPLYGQCDVKGSSEARNKAIKEDLQYQLSETITLFKKFLDEENLLIYKETIYRLEKILNSITDGIKTTDELEITNILKDNIYPILEHLKTTKPNFRELINIYNSEIDNDLNVIYKKRKAYEDFITDLNTALAKHLDNAQKEAQSFYPHYFERFKTDGLDYNIYIGKSITNNRKFNHIYVQNLKLWQLQQQCKLEYIAKKIDIEHTEISLKVTSLILVHPTSLDIKFRMDEKKFDVDGAYNMRYEIVKKRIDKSYIKGTSERLTQPGKISIVYTHEEDAYEYIKYIEYLTEQDYLLKEVESLEIEDLQGVSGLKALRVSVNYNKCIKDELSFKKLMEVNATIHNLGLNT